MAVELSGSFNREHSLYNSLHLGLLKVAHIFYMDKKKKIVFEDLEVNYAKLKIRLRHDGLGQSDFFSFIVQKYIACDPQFLFFVDELKESRSKFGKRRLKKSLDDIKKGEELMNDLGISDTDKEKIFDLIEAEYGKEED